MAVAVAVDGSEESAGGGDGDDDPLNCQAGTDTYIFRYRIRNRLFFRHANPESLAAGWNGHFDMKLRYKHKGKGRSKKLGAACQYALDKWEREKVLRNQHEAVAAQVPAPRARAPRARDGRTDAAGPPSVLAGCRLRLRRARRPESAGRAHRRGGAARRRGEGARRRVV